MNIDELIKTLDEKDLAGQVLCYDIYDKDEPSEVEKVISEIRPGALFLDNMSREKIQMYTNMANKYTKVPVIVAADVEFGPGENMSGLPVYPNVMAWSACDDEKLVEKVAEITAKICRLHGLSWTLSPVVDINMNFNNPIVNIRSASDSPEQIKKIMGAFVRGVQKDGYMVATLKHFPGDGVDDRNQHFCTTVNTLSMDEWHKTFGNVYKEMIKQGVSSVMSAHIGLPAYADEYDELGAVPAILSKPLMTDLLKGELGFDGCIVSDAMSMVGAAARKELDKLAVTFLNCGGDIILFNEPDDHKYILNALNDGILPKERLLDAVYRMIRLKEKARMFEDSDSVVAEIGETQEELIDQLEKLSYQIAEKSIKFVRNINHLLPIKPKKESKFLCINISDSDKVDPSPIQQELQKRGFTVDALSAIGHKKLNEIMYDYDYILFNYFMIGSHGGTMRSGWGQIAPFWRGYVLKHPNVIFTSFGDPYKLYDYPFLKTYINAFSYTESSMRAFVRVLLGEVEMTAKNPISLKGFFERETL